MGLRISVAALALAFRIAIPMELHAQDIPGIEICTVEKAMDRRTSCLQSNVEFLQKTLNKLMVDHQQKLDASNRQVEALKATVAGLQKVIADLQAAQKQMADDLRKQAEAQPAKGAAVPGTDATKK